MGSVGPILGVKRQKLTTHLHLMPRSRMVEWDGRRQNRQVTKVKRANYNDFAGFVKMLSTITDDRLTEVASFTGFTVHIFSNEFLLILHASLAVVIIHCR
jgi:hypothetical protein